MKAKDKNSLAEVLIQSPLKPMKGLPLTPAGFKLYFKELPWLHPQCGTHTSWFCACPQSKIRVESGSEPFLLLHKVMSACCTGKKKERIKKIMCFNFQQNKADSQQTWTGPLSFCAKIFMQILRRSPFLHTCFKAIFRNGL